MSSITATRMHRLARGHHAAQAEDQGAAVRWREDVLAAVAEGQSVRPAGVTNALLAELTPDLQIGERTAAVLALRSDGLLVRIGLHLRLTAAGQSACAEQWANTNARPDANRPAAQRTMIAAAAPPRRTLTDADAKAILDQFGALVDRNPGLAQEIARGFERQWRTIEDALTHGRVEVTERMAAQVACMADGIRDRLADLVVGA